MTYVIFLKEHPLQSYYFFEKMSRASQYPILGNGCVRMRFQKAGQGLVQ